jgi:hypothetical protein
MRDGTARPACEGEPAMSPPVLATRTRKARRESVCSICWRPVRVGQIIAKAEVWVHAGCLIERNRRTSTEGKTT